MPESIEVSTKLIAFVTAIIMLIAAVLTLRKKTGTQNTTPSAEKKKGADADIWEMFKFFAGFVALGFLFLAAMLGFKWFIVLFQAIK